VVRVVQVVRTLMDIDLRYYKSGAEGGAVALLLALP